ncbi:sensor domain-containing protein, partial [Romboutsia sp.]|uniref:sensor domain-containing protein n=1 Tax=Romboutsia sp. TaxID=1965302 RepID=UPI003F3F18A8
MNKKSTMDMLDENLQEIQQYKRIIKNKDKKFQSLIDKIPIAVWVKDNRGIYTELNSKYCDFSQTIPSQIIGKSDIELWDEKIANRFIEEDNIIIQTKKPITFEEIQLFTTEEKVYRVTKSPLFDSEGIVVGVIGTSQDITDFKLREVNMLKNIGTDFMTKIPNRRGLYGYLEDKLKNEIVTVMFIDIDEFKKINDVYGHKFGDDVLKIIANRICEFFKEDFVARIGGDEFVIVTKEKEENEELVNFLNELMSKISLDICIGGQKCFVSGSIGVANSSPEDTIESILIKADLSMYSAKKKGKNTFHFYEDGMIEEIETNSNIEVDLYNAIEKGEICLHYQPQFSGDKTLVGFESLFRWNNEKYKNIPVSKVISIIEQNKLIHKIGKFIFETACVFAREINENSEDEINVSINISPIQLMREDFILEVKSIIKETKVNPSWIGIEITEGIFLDNMEKSIDIISELKNLGIEIFLDDFGTGYSSLNYLVKLPISSIKIDK